MHRGSPGLFALCDCPAVMTDSPSGLRWIGSLLLRILNQKTKGHTSRIVRVNSDTHQGPGEWGF